MKSLIKYLKPALTLFLVLAGTSLMSQQTAVVAEEIDRPIYEDLGMSPTALASIMLIFTAVLVGFVISLAGSARNILEYKQSKMKNGLKTILVLAGVFMAPELFAADAAAAPSQYLISFPDSAFWTFFTLDIILVMVILYLGGIIRGVLSEYKVPSKINVFARWNKTMTDAVPMEEESSILLDHDYDGIKELDNNLPPWWKYGFYITIVWAVGYLFYYNIFNFGPLQEQEYLAAMEEGDREVAEYKKAHPVLINADNVTALEDDASIAKGQNVYTTYCQTCHMEKGRGGAGPNLTDNTWIYGGDIKTVFTTVSEGTKNGMAIWKDIISAEEIQAVSSYILRLEPVLPPEGKLPEGKIVE
ncbi:MAG: c-type cytochrome [Bacteroidetes bacterium]|nr:c-type cytochrome [Bacteroidota bacterium]